MPELSPRNLHKLVKVGFNKMETFRKARLRFFQQYTSRFYGRSESDWGAEDKKAAPINLIHQAVTTLLPNLIYNDPKFKCRTNYMGYRQYADMLATATNEVMYRMKYSRTLRKVITDAIFMAGFTKTGIAVSGQTLDLDGTELDIGAPYAERVDPDDMVLDPMARDWEEQVLIGNKFCLPLAQLQMSGLYDPDLLKKYQQNYSDQMRNSARGLSTSYNMASEADEATQMMELVELYIPSDKIIVTIPYAPDGGCEEYLNVVDYEGPDNGPYKMLGFAFVPDNILPVAPAMIWYDLHMLANRIARKIARQAERMKQVLAYEANAVEDAQEVIDSDDGDSIRVDNIDGIKEIRFGGTNDDAYKFAEWCKGNFSEMANSLEMLSGASGDDASTATEAQILNANSSVRLADMQQLVYHHVAEVGTDIAKILHEDPLIELPLITRVGGEEQQVVYTPEMRVGRWFDYNISVQPMSMARQDPNVKVKRMLEFASSVIPAAANAFQMLGPAFNIQGFLALIAREVGIEEADEIINNPLLQQSLMAQMQAIQTPTKVLTGGKPIGQPGMMAPPPGAGGFRPQQPNPRATAPAGETPETDARRGQQELAAVGQSAFA